MSYKKGYINYITQNIGSERMLFSLLLINIQSFKNKSMITYIFGNQSQQTSRFLMFIVFKYTYLWLSVCASYTQSGHF